jgi:hypothetical protein
MALKRTSGSSKEKSGSSYVNIPEGEYEGRLIYVADLGLQARSFSGEEKPPAYQIALGIELVGQTVEFDGEVKPRLMWTKGFNIFSTMNEKGAELRYYKVFDPKANEDTFADWDKQLGKPCSVQVGHRQGKGEYADNVFDEITGVSPVPYKYQSSVPPASLIPCIGECEDEDNDATKALYGLVKWIHGRRLHA